MIETLYDLKQRLNAINILQNDIPRIALDIEGDFRYTLESIRVAREDVFSYDHPRNVEIILKIRRLGT